MLYYIKYDLSLAISSGQINWFASGGTFDSYVLFLQDWWANVCVMNLRDAYGFDININQYVGYFYSPVFGALAQRMYCFNFYAAESADLLLGWFNAWLSFGFGFDLSNFTGWGIEVEGIALAPLSIQQQYIMRFFESSFFTSFGFSAEFISLLRTWTFSFKGFRVGEVQAFFFGNAGFRYVRLFIAYFYCGSYIRAIK